MESSWRRRELVFLILYAIGFYVFVIRRSLQLSHGVDQESVDSQKGIVTVVGEVDPVCVATRIRKTGKVAEIISVAPPKKPDPPKPHQPQSQSNTKPHPLPSSSPQCQVIAIGYEPYVRICSIL